jgi:hypothetical protein
MSSRVRILSKLEDISSDRKIPSYITDRVRYKVQGEMGEGGEFNITGNDPCGEYISLQELTDVNNVDFMLLRRGVRELKLSCKIDRDRVYVRRKDIKPLGEWLDVVSQSY